TFVAILLGTILGGGLVSIAARGETVVSATVVSLAVGGWLASRWVPSAPSQATELRLHWSPLRETLRTIGFARENRTVFLSILGMAPAGPPILWRPFLASAGHWRVLADLMLIGAFGGFFIVPLQALVQQRSEPSRRSRIIAGNNILGSLFIVLAAVLGIVLRDMGLGIPQLILVTALVNAAVAVYTSTLPPQFLMRYLVRLVVPAISRMAP